MRRHLTGVVQPVWTQAGNTPQQGGMDGMDCGGMMGGTMWAGWLLGVLATILLLVPAAIAAAIAMSPAVE